ncbi:hypothetical protein [Pararhizobium sp. O133]|uniref:hypothetical protein n=1 Tax=Pararhizobium sp. O133 TaxID=3449278 RepID=UPI003F6894B7
MLQFMKPGVGTILPEDARAHEEWVEVLMRQDYVIETWHCDLSTGLFTIGDITRNRHSLGDNLCGLLDIIRGYPEDHHKTVLNILEEATAEASSFCFCTTMRKDRQEDAPLFCVGTSTIGNGVSSAGRMQGIFAFTPVD